MTRGSSDALSDFGLETFVADSDLVVSLPLDSDLASDRAGAEHALRFIDVDPADEALIGCLEMIKREWEREFPDEAHLGHAAAGNWFFYWFSPQMQTMSDLLRANRAEDLRAAARAFVGKHFGWDGAPDIEVSA